MVAAVIACEGSAETESREIARALRQRDATVLGQLIARHHYRLFRYLAYLTGRRELAEDLVQETWVRVLERGRQYDGRSRFEKWLFSVAHNLAFDHLRRRRDAGEPESLPQLPAAADSPFAAAARSEDAERLAAALTVLDPAYREALVLRFQEELSLQEISEITGSPLTTVSSRIYRGLAILRNRLEEVPDAG